MNRLFVYVARIILPSLLKSQFFKNIVRQTMEGASSLMKKHSPSEQQLEALKKSFQNQSAKNKQNLDKGVKKINDQAVSSDFIEKLDLTKSYKPGEKSSKLDSWIQTIKYNYMAWRRRK